MAPLKPSFRHVNTCLRCVRPTIGPNSSLNGAAARLLSTSSSAQDQAQVQATTNAGDRFPLNPETAWRKKEERYLLNHGTQPIGSRRRRVALRSGGKDFGIPFEQLPYQCFQEARKVLREDREEKIRQIETQKVRLQKLMAQDPEASGGVMQKEARIRSMKAHIEELIILADINDPMVKKRFEDGQGDMNKPIYRYLADKKWRKYKRLILEQRIKQFHIVPDFLPALDPIADVDLAFGRRQIPPGEYVHTAVSENMPRLKVQTFEPGEKLVTVLIVTGDIPDPAKDTFNSYCHLVACNIPISPTETSIPLNRLALYAPWVKTEANEATQTKGGETPKESEAASPSKSDSTGAQIVKPWHRPYSLKGAPYQRQVVFVLEQTDRKPLNLKRIFEMKRSGFNTHSFVDTNKLKPIGVSLFRTQWDENTPKVLEALGREDKVNVEFKRKRVEPLPYKRRTERMR